MQNCKPFLDEMGLMRVGSGLHTKAAFNWDTKRPILMHANMPITQAIMKDAHHKVLGHQNGIEGLLAEVRKRFWVIGARKAAKKIIKECMRCAKKKWTELQVELPPFHPSRSVTLRAFMEVGVDHAGPFRLRQGRSTVEAHVLVIACCTTRNVSLEMSMSTGAGHVLAALQRHIGVFGNPRYINSDQGSGFVNAKRLIAESHEAWRKKRMGHARDSRMADESTLFSDMDGTCRKHSQVDKEGIAEPSSRPHNPSPQS